MKLVAIVRRSRERTRVLLLKILRINKYQNKLRGLIQVHIIEIFYGINVI